MTRPHVDAPGEFGTKMSETLELAWRQDFSLVERGRMSLAEAIDACVVAPLKFASAAVWSGGWGQTTASPAPYMVSNGARALRDGPTHNSMLPPGHSASKLRLEAPAGVWGLDQE